MSFPTTTAYASETDSLSTTHTVNIGSPASGDLVVIHAGFMSGSNFATSGNHTPPSGWMLERETRGQNWAMLTITLYKVCDGTEGATVSLTIANTAVMACRAWKYASGTYTGVVKSAAANGTSSSPNPPTVTPDGGSADYHFIATAHVDRFATLSSGPTGYDAPVAANGDPGGSPRVYSWFAERELNASSDDPSAYTVSISNNWSAHSLAVQGTASGGSAIAPISSGYHLRGMR